jgi:hypothetical protein
MKKYLLTLFIIPVLILVSPAASVFASSNIWGITPVENVGWSAGTSENIAWRYTNANYWNSGCTQSVSLVPADANSLLPTYPGELISRANGFGSGRITIPADAVPGQYQVKVRCFAFGGGDEFSLSAGIVTLANPSFQPLILVSPTTPVTYTAGAYVPVKVQANSVLAVGTSVMVKLVKKSDQAVVVWTATGDLINIGNPNPYFASAIQTSESAQFTGDVYLLKAEVMFNGQNYTATSGDITFTAPAPSDKFTIGPPPDQVTPNRNSTAVRSTAGDGTEPIDSQDIGALGTVIGGPTPGDNYIWWKIDWASGPSGWSREDLLDKYTAPPLTLWITQSATGISASGSTLNALWNRSNGTDTRSATGWFRYSVANPGSCNNSFGQTAPASGNVDLGAGANDAPFSKSISDLSPSTTYYFCAIVAIPGVTIYLGDLLSFTTTDRTPSGDITSLITNASSYIIDGPDITITWQTSLTKPKLYLKRYLPNGTAVSIGSVAMDNSNGNRSYSVPVTSALFGTGGQWYYKIFENSDGSGSFAQSGNFTVTSDDGGTPIVFAAEPPEWKDPLYSPPECTGALGDDPGCFPPINVSITPQWKQGALQVGALTSILGIRITNSDENYVLPSDSNRSLALGVNGRVGATEYCDKDGNNCIVAGTPPGGGDIPSSCTEIGKVLKWNGANWVCDTDLTGGGDGPVDSSVWQSRVTGVCPTGQYMYQINPGGDVACRADVTTGDPVASSWTVSPSGTHQYSNLSGNVGIGFPVTTDNTPKLIVRKDTTGSIFAAYNNNDSRFSVLTDGSVCIGPASVPGNCKTAWPTGGPGTTYTADETTLRLTSGNQFTIKNMGVDTTQLALNAVNGNRIQDNAVSRDKLSTDAVTTVKIANKAVTSSKLNPSIYQSNLCLDVGNPGLTPKICDIGPTSSYLFCALGSVQLMSSSLNTQGGVCSVQLENSTTWRIRALAGVSPDDSILCSAVCIKATD